MNLLSLTAVELGKKIKAHEVTVEEATRAALDAIRAKEKDSDYAVAYKYIIEEVAYTWFNRLIAVRFMEVNDYLPSHVRVLSSESGKTEPDIVTNPFDSNINLLIAVNGASIS